jgi:hypothetical protein
MGRLGKSKIATKLVRMLGRLTSGYLSKSHCRDLQKLALLIEGMIFSEKGRTAPFLRKNHPWILQPPKIHCLRNCDGASFRSSQ